MFIYEVIFLCVYAFEQLGLQIPSCRCKHFMRVANQ